ncbi:MAG: molybdopterin-guanine dinucleotide biosynthesis protein A [Bacteroidia bacterium]
MTTVKKHKKHNKIPRRSFGDFGASELAFVGTSCSNIQLLSKVVIKDVSNEHEVGYVDADHKSFEQPEKGDYLEQGAAVYFSDKQLSKQLLTTNIENPFDYKIAFNSIDVAFVNGNHFKADFQIVFLDTSKTKSLEKRMDQLTNVLAIVHVDTNVMPQSISDKIPDIESLPTFDFKDTAGISGFVSEWLNSRIPTIKALLLAGGKSTRMGKDKATLEYKNTQQLERLLGVIKPIIPEVFVSCRKDQQFPVDAPYIYDRTDDMGPLGGITTAFRTDPNAAWLVIACDLPMIDSTVIEQLIKSRSTKHIATAFLNDETGFAEPLITIWEPKSYMRLMQFEALGYTCPRKVLINSKTNLITPNDASKLLNVNTPEEFAFATKALG